jgi:hypothetical protein
LRKAEAEVALLEAEAQRRQALLAAGKLDPFAPTPADGCPGDGGS